VGGVKLFSGEKKGGVDWKGGRAPTKKKKKNLSFYGEKKFPLWSSKKGGMYLAESGGIL